MVKIFLEFLILPFGYLREWPKPCLVAVRQAHRNLVARISYYGVEQ